MEKENLRKVKYPHPDAIPVSINYDYEKDSIPKTEEGFLHEFVTLGENVFGLVEDKNGDCYKIPAEFIQFISEDKPLLQETKEPKKK